MKILRIVNHIADEIDPDVTAYYFEVATREAANRKIDTDAIVEMRDLGSIQRKADREELEVLAAAAALLRLHPTDELVRSLVATAATQCRTDRKAN